MFKKIFGNRTKRIFIAATKRDVGKTTVSLGLLASMRKRYPDIGFIKPVGQRYLLSDGFRIDEDSVLMDRIFDLGLSLHDMSPVAVERGFTERFLEGGRTSDEAADIRKAFNNVAMERDAVVIEGTGHAGVGSVFDLSNAAVARMLDARVILVSPGGIGNPIDEIMLNKSLFDKFGVEMAGVIVNKVRPQKYQKIKKYVTIGLKRLGVKVLGVIPYMELLEKPSIHDFREELDMHVLCGKEHLDTQMKKVLVGAMEVNEAAQYLEDNCLVITPGNRTDLINLLIRSHTGRFRTPRKIGGLILSGGMIPQRRIFSALKKTGIPTLVSRYNTYETASRVHDLTVKIKSRDKKKVDMAVEMFEQYAELEEIIRAFE
jgi:hypothetical protein